MRAPPVLGFPRLKHNASTFAFFAGRHHQVVDGAAHASSEYDLHRLAATSREAAPPPRGALQRLLLWLVLRLKYALLAAPMVAVALGVYAAVYASFAESSKQQVDVTLFAPIITCVFFVLSIVFSNVIADYKESEKLPADIVSYFSALTAFAVAEARERGFSARPLLLDVQAMLLCMLSTLDKKRGYVADLRTFHEACVSYKVCARAQGVHETEVPEHAAAELAKKMARIHDIGRLSIILPAYTLMDILVVALFGIVMVVDYKNEFTNFAAICVLFTVAVFMNLLVHGLDDPFDGPPDYHFRCYISRREIELSYSEAWRYGLMINFGCLTADFGSMLRRLITEADGEEADRPPPPPPPEQGLH